MILVISTHLALPENLSHPYLHRLQCRRNGHPFREAAVAPVQPQRPSSTTVQRPCPLVESPQLFRFDGFIMNTICPPQARDPLFNVSTQLDALLRDVEILRQRTELAERRSDHAERELALVRRSLSEDQPRAVEPAVDGGMLVEVEQLRAAVRSMEASLQAATAGRAGLVSRPVRQTLPVKAKRGSPSSGAQVARGRSSTKMRPSRDNPLPDAVSSTGAWENRVEGATVALHLAPEDISSTGPKNPMAPRRPMLRPLPKAITSTRAWENVVEDTTVAQPLYPIPGAIPPTRARENLAEAATVAQPLDPLPGAIPSPGPRSPAAHHQRFYPDPVALNIMKGAKQLGLKPLFSEPYSAFVLSDSVGAEKFMKLVLEKSASMGHPGNRAIRAIGVSFELKNQSGHAPLTIALAEGLVAIFEISRICNAQQVLPASLVTLLGKYGAMKVGFQIKENFQRFQSFFKLGADHVSVINIDDLARAKGLPVDSLTSLAKHVGVYSGAEHGQPDPGFHRRNADAALASLRLLRALRQSPVEGDHYIRGEGPSPNLYLQSALR
ncbi:hypothetical protein BDK51DRAFT_40167 [Blyttiomyces helicus]|uniref:3'-5' exonuclease domain-containing protein n=1 Tax=Blyttiomyces helicus TaxID=388810 RepID=A0A4P9WCZ6_9FUNG|nr:hypothetical protein BDK51DRAFT_40167 [Blyttiomyces helicus]|eukprot:RKO89098.1 hypothetical protein BDK51DRAFT_40167 [Blyttiomyces helicus]